MLDGEGDSWTLFLCKCVCVCACVRTWEDEGGMKSRRGTDGNEDREGAGMTKQKHNLTAYCQFEVRKEGISALSLARCTAAPPLPFSLSRRHTQAIPQTISCLTTKSLL